MSITHQLSWPQALAVTLLLWCSKSYAFDFAIEQADLVPASKEINQFLQSQTSYRDSAGKPCRFQGKQLQLASTQATARAAASAGEPQKDWILTTTAQCAWANGVAPLLVLQRWTKGYAILLEVQAYELTIGAPERNGMHNLATAADPNTSKEYALWHFDGTRYVLKSIKQK